MLKKQNKIILLAILAVMLVPSIVCALPAKQTIELNYIGTYRSGIFDEGAAEIVAYDPATTRLFVTNADQNTIDILNIQNPVSPVKVRTIDLSPYGGGVNSVATKRGIVAAAVEHDNKQEPGCVVFFDTAGTFLNKVTAGALPDMVTFTPNGRYVLAANEGEPNDDYTVDPEGSVTIINISRGVHAPVVRTAGFEAFNSAALDPSIRIYGPGATVAQDLEPEYIAVSHDSKTAFVACQENNALAIIDIRKAKVQKIVGLGTKDHSIAGNGIDASNKDDAVNIATWPVKGFYQPDSIASFRYRGKTLIVSANEGDSRDYDGYSEEERVKYLTLDPTAFPGAALLQENEQLGRLKTTTAQGDTDGDGDFDELYSYGARSFSIWDADGTMIFDSGDDFEQILAIEYPLDFNSTNDENDSFDSRSDDKGPEPEALTVGTINHYSYAFIGLERMGGIMVYDITDPYSPVFVQYITTRDFSGDPESGSAGNLAAEGMAFIPAKDSPNGKPLLAVSYEVSGTTGIFEIEITRRNSRDTGVELPLEGLSGAH